MAENQITIDQLSKLLSPTSNDLLLIYDADTEIFKSITYEDLFKNTETHIYWISGSNNFITTNKDIEFATKLQHGLFSSASGPKSHAEGAYTTSVGDYSHTEGQYTTSIGYYSHTEGYQTTSVGNYSHTEGFNTISVGDYSHAEGYYTTSVGIHSHAEGIVTTSVGDYSHAEGESTDSVGNGSHAEGISTTSIGDYSHAEGQQTSTVGYASHAEGYYTISSGSYSHVQGAYNAINTNPYAFIIGNGTSNANRSNLVYASGSRFDIYGTLYISGSSQITRAIIQNLPVYADNTAAISGGLTTSGSMYRTSTGQLMVTY